MVGFFTLHLLFADASDWRALLLPSDGTLSLGPICSIVLQVPCHSPLSLAYTATMTFVCLTGMRGTGSLVAARQQLSGKVG
jgi:hypothetical protein